MRDFISERQRCEMFPFLLAGSGFHTERLLPSGHAAGAQPAGRITDKEMKTKRADLTELTVSACNKADFNMATAAAEQEAFVNIPVHKSLHVHTGNY